MDCCELREHPNINGVNAITCGRGIFEPCETLGGTPVHSCGAVCGSPHVKELPRPDNLQ